MREIPKKNYVVLVILIIATLFIVFFARQKYLSKKEYDSRTNERIDFISEIKEKEVDNYLSEHREGVIYISSSADMTVVDFESKLKTYVKKEQLGKEMIYINLNNVSDDFYKTFIDRHFSSKLKSSVNELKNQPNMMVVSNGKVVSILYTDDSKINIDDAKKYLEQYVKEGLE